MTKCSHCIFAIREGNRHLLSLYPEKGVKSIVTTETAEADVCVVTRLQRHEVMKQRMRQQKEDSKGAVVKPFY